MGRLSTLHRDGRACRSAHGSERFIGAMRLGWIDKMPAVLDNPNINEPGKTNYLALVGPELYERIKRLLDEIR